MMQSRIQQILSRRTTSNALIPEIDGFRFFAIGTVLLYHLNTHFARTLSVTGATITGEDNGFIAAVSRGSLGVDVFFAISGFILALPFARQRLFNEKPVSLKAYYIRRLTRLEPPYVISLVLLLFVHLLILHESFRNIFPNFLASLFYIHSFVFDEWSKINPVAWSLEVEVQFYVLAPALAVFFSIRKPVWRRLILVAVILVSVAHYNFNYAMIEALHLRKSLFMHLHQFLIGFLFADLFLTNWKETLRQKSFVFDAVGIIALSLLFVCNVPFNPVADLMFSICLFVSFIALFKGKLINAFFTNTWIVIIGGMCYSIYLLHYALIALLAKFSITLLVPEWGYVTNYLLQSLLIVPVVLLVSA
ncbi:MAG TPA: acyltransferase, partial [Cyclobacteriaceae bacterium]|nr:acyltransferase [Cyclobacteriaceae bacterium]